VGSADAVIPWAAMWDDMKGSMNLAGGMRPRSGPVIIRTLHCYLV
jgi:hypothetical protein